MKRLDLSYRQFGRTVTTSINQEFAPQKINLKMTEKNHLTGDGDVTFSVTGKAGLIFCKLNKEYEQANLSRVVYLLTRVPFTKRFVGIYVIREDVYTELAGMHYSHSETKGRGLGWMRLS